MVLIALGAAWLTGLVAVGMLGSPWWMGAAWLIAILPAAFLRVGVNWKLGVSAVVAAALSGLLLNGSLDGEVPPVARFIGEEVELLAVVTSEPDPGRVSTGYEVRIGELRAGEATIQDAGIVRLTLHQYAEYLPGDVLLVSGTLDEPPVFDGFDYRSYLRNRGIWATMLFPTVEHRDNGGWSLNRDLTSLRLRLDRALQRSLPEPEASLGAGIAFGRDGNLSMERKEAYNASGLRHLVAVSGSNMSMVAAMTVALAVPLVGRRRAWIPAAFTIVVYLMVAGFSPSVLRAGIMAGVLLAGGAIGRPQSGMPALSAAFIIMTALDPADALEPGFQLSMSATAGLLTIGPWLTHALERWTSRLPFLSPPVWVCEVAGLSATASLVTTPIMWHHFGELSLVGPLANVVVQPVLLIAFWLSLMAAAAGLVSSTMAWLLSLLAYYPLAFIDAVASFASAPRFATVTAGRASSEAAGLALLPIAVAAALTYRYPPRQAPHSRRTEQRRNKANRVLVSATAGAFVFAAIPLSLLPLRSPGDLQVTFFDVGQGDAILITAPSGQQLLIDGGPSGIELSRQLSATLPHWDRSIGGVVLTHPQEDHLGGLPELLQRFSVETVWTNGAPNRRSQTFATLQERLPESTVAISAGSTIHLGDLAIDVLWPDPGAASADLNDGSLVLRLTYGNVTVLLTGDIEAPAQRALLAREPIGATVLKVPHHGSRTSSTEFLQAVAPTIAVIQAGVDNRFGHPHEETLDALYGARVLRTDLHGRITLTTDGETITVRTAR